MPIALEKFPATYGITDEEKTFFPHFFNTAGNLMCPTLPHLPPKEDYGYRSMKLGKRRQFLRWYNENRDQKFNLREQLVIYCLSDVRLLAEGLVAYRAIFQEECGFEVLRKCTTLASAVMHHFRLNHLQENTIGIASETSYERHDKQSTIGIKYLKYFAWKNQLVVQHVDSPEGEKRLHGGIQVDGFIRRGMDGQSPHLVLEVAGFEIILFYRRILSKLFSAVVGMVAQHVIQIKTTCPLGGQPEKNVADGTIG